jgi:catechol 2,3-dioxygenase-like lactoylglutathione lyase family enzyme
MMDMKLEVLVLPVSDVDRAKRFYEKLGFRLDIDYAANDDYRALQFTPPGSQASIIFGKGVTSAPPGSIDRLIMAVYDIGAARDELVSQGIEVSEVFHDASGGLGGGFHTGTDGRVPGPDPQGRSYGSYASFSDPDGNVWLLQEIKERLPGRGGMTDVAALAQLLHETADHHGSFEAVTPPHDWWHWYAAYMEDRERGSTPEQASAAAARYMADVKHVVVSPA